MMGQLVYFNALGTQGGGTPAGGLSLREFVTVSGPSLGYIRLLLISGVAGLTLTTASISVQGGATQPNVTLRPTQLFFNDGSPGITFGANQSIFTDWALFDFANGDSLGGHFDFPQSGQNAQIGVTPTGPDRLWVAGPPVQPIDYTQATVTGYVDNGNVAAFISRIETAGLNTVINTPWDESWQRTKISAY